jgi:hypothetical protein
VPARNAVSERRPTKRERVLGLFVAGAVLDRWAAARLVRDSCLNSTVAEIEADGIKIERWPAVAEGAYGTVHYRQYRLPPEPENVARAVALLAALRARRGAR